MSFSGGHRKRPPQPGPGFLSSLPPISAPLKLLTAPQRAMLCLWFLLSLPGALFLQGSTPMPLSSRKPSRTLPSLCQPWLRTVPLWSQYPAFPSPCAVLKWPVYTSLSAGDAELQTPQGKPCMPLTILSPGLSLVPTFLYSGTALHFYLIPWIYHNVKTQ